MAARGELGLLHRQSGNDADSGPALAMTASSAGDAAHIVPPTGATGMNLAHAAA